MKWHKCTRPPVCVSKVQSARKCAASSRSTIATCDRARSDAVAWFNATARQSPAHTTYCVRLCDASDFLFLILTAATKFSSSTYTHLKAVTAHNEQCCAQSGCGRDELRTAAEKQVDNFFLFFIPRSRFLCHFIWMSHRSPLYLWLCDILPGVPLYLGGGDDAVFLSEWRCDINAVVHFARILRVRAPT